MVVNKNVGIFILLNLLLFFKICKIFTYTAIQWSLPTASNWHYLNVEQSTLAINAVLTRLFWTGKNELSRQTKIENIWWWQFVLNLPFMIYMRVQVIASFMSLPYKQPPAKPNIFFFCSEHWGLNEQDSGLIMFGVHRRKFGFHARVLLVLVYDRLIILVSIVSDPR